MKKLFSLAFLSAVIFFVSCGDSKAKERARLEKEIEAAQADFKLISSKLYITEDGGSTSLRPEFFVSSEPIAPRTVAELKQAVKEIKYTPEYHSLKNQLGICRSRLDSLRRELKLRREGPDD
ncbi:MAG: hypothetical protein FWC15_05135 [Fibromonadales bacterium]|nr:hypothetical protein [Fibromonadales bacterium]